MASWSARNFLVRATLLQDRVPSFEEFPFSIPAIRGLEVLDFEQPVTFLVGENSAGKSTLLEAIAVGSGLNAEGGSRSFRRHVAAQAIARRVVLRAVHEPAAWRWPVSA